MHGELAQAIALVAYGNQFLASGREEGDLAASNSTFRFVAETRFEYSEGGPATAVAGDSQAWFRWLASRNATRLQLGARGGQGPLPGHLAVAFAGAGEWVVLAHSPDRNQYWRALWAFTTRGSPRPWNVVYLGHPVAEAWPSKCLSLLDARDSLSHALRDTRQLATEIGVSNWVDWFQAAEAQLTSPQPVARFHDDALPSGYTLSARQLFAAAVGSWVFGGMGSWNDLSPEAALKQRYEEVSSRLYRAVLQSFESVLDSPGVS